jgi:DNA-binding IclR family transcriptional regulator
MMSSCDAYCIELQQPVSYLRDDPFGYCKVGVTNIWTFAVGRRCVVLTVIRDGSSRNVGIGGVALAIGAKTYRGTVLERMTETLHESSSMSMLDGGEIVYVARSAASRVLAAGLSVGSRLPAYCTSMGRVLLASLPDAELDAYFRVLKPKAYTRKTIVKIPELRKTVLAARHRGYAIVNEELEQGLRSVAVPVYTNSNRIVAAINVGTHVSRVDHNTLIRTCLPVLREGARSLREILL